MVITRYLPIVLALAISFARAEGAELSRRAEPRPSASVLEPLDLPKTFREAFPINQRMTDVFTEAYGSGLIRDRVDPALREWLDRIPELMQSEDPMVREISWMTIEPLSSIQADFIKSFQAFKTEVDPERQRSIAGGLASAIEKAHFKGIERMAAYVKGREEKIEELNKNEAITIEELNREAESLEKFNFCGPAFIQMWTHLEIILATREVQAKHPGQEISERDVVGQFFSQISEKPNVGDAVRTFLQQAFGQSEETSQEVSKEQSQSAAVEVPANSVEPVLSSIEDLYVHILSTEGLDTPEAQFYGVPDSFASQFQGGEQEEATAYKRERRRLEDDLQAFGATPFLLGEIVSAALTYHPKLKDHVFEIKNVNDPDRKKFQYGSGIYVLMHGHEVNEEGNKVVQIVFFCKTDSDNADDLEIGFYLPGEEMDEVAQRIFLYNVLKSYGIAMRFMPLVVDTTGKLTDRIGKHIPKRSYFVERRIHSSSEVERLSLN